jgi:hypothetical protein
MKLGTALFIVAAAFIVGAIWLSWPAPKLRDCGDILSAPSVHECDTTKGSPK